MIPRGDLVVGDIIRVLGTEVEVADVVLEGDDRLAMPHDLVLDGPQMLAVVAPRIGDADGLESRDGPGELEGSRDPEGVVSRAHEGSDPEGDSDRRLGHLRLDTVRHPIDGAAIECLD